ncbi:hypothetical protein [Bradyrhizobium canariense]|uniref:Uncharacterized protein n=1 Tax=Bradyrhizobium canariense TaxID=255045 RepID=A0A1H1UAA1_9BRAD|nr:hypothetical protein [Bradyrhizobium canariense]SDS69347.1 hypothetical protein SAMN05444158_2876 [Bradyrhizobium canariense]
MRKFILVTVMVLVSATAQAGGTRGLTLASNDDPAVAEPAAPVETPKAVEQPSVIDTKTEQPAATQCQPATPKNADASATPVAPKASEAPKATRHTHRRASVEAQVISELHRHGIYW